MREIPKNILKSLKVLIKPYINGDIDEEALKIAIYNSINQKVSLSEIAKNQRVTKEAILARFKNKNIKPCGKGGKSGREYLYYKSDLLKM